MARYCSLLIAWGCLAILVLAPLAAAFYLFNLDAFATLASSTLNLPIHWQSVTTAQWYGLWLLSVLYLALGLACLYFLRRAFVHFAKGELFNLNNSRDLRIFAGLLFAQAVATPVQSALASLLLSWHHPPGQKLLSVSFGSGEIKVIALAMILWVMSDLLIKANRLESENRQFV